MLTTEPDGSFNVYGPPGTYSIGVYTPGFAPYGGQPANVAAGATWDFGDLHLQRGGTIAVHLSRDVALAKAEIQIYANLPGSGASNSLPVLGDAAHSEVLSPGEYLIEVIGPEGPVAIAHLHPAGFPLRRCDRRGSGPW